MQVVNLRELRRDLAEVLEGLMISGRPALITRSGRLVAMIAPVAEADLGGHLLGQSQRFLATLRQADERAERGAGVEAERALGAARKRARRAAPG